MMDVQVLCGAEEPLSPNPQLLALDEHSGDARFADFGEAGLNRYCFIGVGRATEADNVFARILSRIVTAQALAATRFVVWQTGGQGVSRVRHRVMARKLAKEGWVITSRDLISVAALALQTAERPKLRPPASDDRCSGWAVVFGPGVTAETFLSPPFLASLAVFARTNLLYPSPEFVEGLKINRWGIAYDGKDSVGRHGLVVVMPAEIGTVLTRLVQDGLLSEVRRGGAAPSVWLQPPVDPVRER